MSERGYHAHVRRLTSTRGEMLSMLGHTCKGLMKGSWLGNPLTWGSLIACLASNVSNYNERAELMRFSLQITTYSGCWYEGAYAGSCRCGLKGGRYDGS